MMEQWQKESGLIFLSVATLGLSGEQWLARHTASGVRVCDETRRLLMRQEHEQKSQFDERLTESGTANAVIVSGYTGRMSGLLALQKKRGWRLSPPEVACTLRESLTDADLRDMGLQWLTIQSPPFKWWTQYSEAPRSECNLLLSINRNGAFNNTGEKDTGGKHLAVSSTLGISDLRHGHLFLC